MPVCPDCGSANVKARGPVDDMEQLGTAKPYSRPQIFDCQDCDRFFQVDWKEPEKDSQDET